MPVGTGVLIAGGNFNSTDNNEIYDNWRYGTMQFWVPAPLRDEFDPAKLYDTSHGNRTFGNEMGFGPGGQKLYNGMDHWWDDEGEGNCWENNTSSRGEPTDNFTRATRPPAPTAARSSPPAPRRVKDAGFLSCSQYDRNDPTLRHPPECNWFDSPPKPTNDLRRPVPGGPGRGACGPAVLVARRPGGGWAVNLLALGALLGVGAAFRARRTTRRADVRQALTVAATVTLATVGGDRGGGGHRAARTWRRRRGLGHRHRPASAVFTLGDRTVRQIRYVDGATLGLHVHRRERRLDAGDGDRAARAEPPAASVRVPTCRRRRRRRRPSPFRPGARPR